MEEKRKKLRLVFIVLTITFLFCSGIFYFKASERNWITPTEIVLEPNDEYSNSTLPYGPNIAIIITTISGSNTSVYYSISSLNQDEIYKGNLSAYDGIYITMPDKYNMYYLMNTGNSSQRVEIYNSYVPKSPYILISFYVALSLTVFCASWVFYISIEKKYEKIQFWLRQTLIPASVTLVTWLFLIFMPLIKITETFYISNQPITETEYYDSFFNLAINGRLIWTTGGPGYPWEWTEHVADLFVARIIFFSPILIFLITSWIYYRKKKPKNPKAPTEPESPS